MTILYILTITLHFIFDWVLQPREIANKKGFTEEGTKAVVNHIFINIIPFSVVLFMILGLCGFDLVLVVSLLFVNLFLHAVIDTLLPKGATEREKINWTAVDQILHISILIFLISLL